MFSVFVAVAASEWELMEEEFRSAADAAVVAEVEAASARKEGVMEVEAAQTRMEGVMEAMEGMMEAEAAQARVEGMLEAEAGSARKEGVTEADAAQARMEGMIEAEAASARTESADSVGQFPPATWNPSPLTHLQMLFLPNSIPPFHHKTAQALHAPQSPLTPLDAQLLAPAALYPADSRLRVSSAQSNSLR